MISFGNRSYLPHPINKVMFSCINNREEPSQVILKISGRWKCRRLRILSRVASDLPQYGSCWNVLKVIPEHFRYSQMYSVFAQSTSLKCSGAMVFKKKFTAKVQFISLKLSKNLFLGFTQSSLILLL